MTKFLQLTLRRVAVIVAWARSCFRQREKESAAIPSLPTVSPEAGEKKPVDPPGEVNVPVTQAEVSQQPNSVSVPEVARDSPAPTSSELQPFLPDSRDTAPEQAAEVSSSSPQPDAPAVAEPPISQAELPTPPEIVVSAEPTTNVAEAATARVDDVSKTAAPLITLPKADSSPGISAGNADAATISASKSAETPSVGEEGPSVETPQQTTASKTAETHTQKRESKRIAAEHRGGARVTSDELDALPEQRERKRFERRLRLVCFKDNYRMWRLAVELPEGVGGTSDVRVTRDSKELPQADFAGNRWLLDNASGTVEAVWLADGIQERGAMELRGDGFLLFKLLQEGQAEEGRLVRAPSNGQYFVAVRQGLEISESRGIEVRGESNFAVSGLVAFRFSVHEDTRPKLEFTNASGVRVAVPFRTPSFTLVGQCAPACFGELHSPVFLDAPPIIRAQDAESWSHVAKVVLGLEGGGWRTHFKPDPVAGEVALSQHLNRMQSGWFFLRFYDAEENRIEEESVDFAFCSQLRSVEVVDVHALPQSDGHCDGRIVFEHDAGVAIEAIGQERLGRECSMSRTAFRLPASPLCEEFRWQLCVAGSSQITGTIEVERVWWALGKEGQAPTGGDWTSKPVAVPQDGFRANSHTVIWIRLPQAAWVNDFRAGFCRATARLYRTPATRREIAIPLREFESAEELRKAGGAELNLWLKLQGVETSAELVRIKVVDRPVRSEQRFSSTNKARGHRKERLGTVVSNKMAKTIVVRVERRFAHPRYKKVVTSYAKFYAHDEKSEAKVGDAVLIQETRPLSRLKRWRLTQIVKRASESVLSDA